MRLPIPLTGDGSLSSNFYNNIALEQVSHVVISGSLLHHLIEPAPLHRLKQARTYKGPAAKRRL